MVNFLEEVLRGFPLAHSFLLNLYSLSKFFSMYSYRPIYHTRHSFATMMLEHGETSEDGILWISSMLGHTSVAMTLDKYTHYVKKVDKKRGQFLKGKIVPIDTENDTELLNIA